MVDKLEANERLALEAIKAVTATTKDAVAGLSRIMAITRSAGVVEPYSELMEKPNVALIVNEPRTEWRHLFEQPVGCTIPPIGWRCTRTPGHDGPCAAVPATPTEDARERAQDVAHRIVADFRPAGWPAKEEEIVRLLLRTFGEDARERVKVLEEALEDRDRAKAVRSRHLLHMAVSGEMDTFDDWAEEASIRAMIEFAAPVHDALGLALSYLVQNEPGDSRAVSDEFVAMAAIHAGLGGEKAMAVIRDAIARTALGNKETDRG